MDTLNWRNLLGTTGLFLALIAAVPCRAELAQTIERIKPSVVGVGTFQKMRNPSVNFLGTGFAIEDGLHVVTNAHVVPPVLDAEKMEALVVLVGGSKEPQTREAQPVAVDKEHDLALLKISGPPLPAMALGDSSAVREGQVYAFTGFPIGMALGFHPVTHRGMISSLTPIVRPGLSSKQLDAKMINRIRAASYNVFQLDGTAYPGNSGSPLYHPETGAVYGIINMVFVKGTKETALSQPSGITYAIPGNYIRDLLGDRRAASR
jgi:S1-C subfamily serine protease